MPSTRAEEPEVGRRAGQVGEAGSPSLAWGAELLIAFLSREVQEQVRRMLRGAGEGG